MIGVALVFYGDVVTTIESIVKIAAIAVGGVSTWTAFIRRRLRYPIAKLEHLITSWGDADRTFLHVTLRINNSGAVLMRVSKACTWLERLSPLPPNVRQNIQSGLPIVKSDRTDIEWTQIEQRNTSQEFSLEIEPGEPDEIHFDFAIDPEIKRVLIYTHLVNEKKKRKGWNLSTIYDIPMDMATHPIDEQGQEKKPPPQEPVRTPNAPREPNLVPKPQGPQKEAPPPESPPRSR